MIELVHIAWSAGEFSLHDVNCAVPEGKYTVLMGRTGCGKTTVLELICGLRRPTEGRIMVAGRDVATICPSAFLTIFVISRSARATSLLNSPVPRSSRQMVPRSDPM